jgi:2-amino-4-hydroxy-6-hydroxymethyldihydropteridine diphosphokinase
VSKTVYLSLGSNLGDRERNLGDALALLRSPGLTILRVSSLYETEPLDVRDQPRFLNAVVEADSDLFPKQLLARIRKIELRLGRRRLRSKGPRTIDIDILLFGDSVIETEELLVPHPRLAERRFVLEPLAELAPDLRHPITRRTVREMLAAVADQQVRKLSNPGQYTHSPISGNR